MNFKRVWKELEGYGEPSMMSEKLFEIYQMVVFSSAENFGDIREFVENTDENALEQAFYEIAFTPSMEEGEDAYEGEPKDRYHLYSNDFREICIMSDFQGRIWNKSKPKKKRFF